MEEERTVVETRPAATEVVTRQETPPVAVDQVRATAYDPYADRRRASSKLVQAIYLVFGIVEALIAIRFVLKLLAANPAAGFATFIYGLTAPLVAPFVGLFGAPQAGGSVLEFNALVALVVYALVAWLVAKVVWLLVGESRSAVVSDTTDVRARPR